MALPVTPIASLDFLPKAYYDIGRLGGSEPNDRMWWGVFQVVFTKEQFPPVRDEFVIVENTSSLNFFYKYTEIAVVTVCEGVYPAVFSEAEVTKPPCGVWYHTSCDGEMRAEIIKAYDALKNMENVAEVYLCTSIPNENMVIVQDKKGCE